MTRATRVSIELFAPPLLGSSPFLLMAIITGTFALVPVVLLVAYLVAIVPSLIFTGLMELAFWRGLDPRSPKAILLAGFLGLAAGVAMGLALGGPSATEHARVFGLIGLFVGATTALIVWWKSAPAVVEPRPPPPSATP
jgi:hypothetical protein